MAATTAAALGVALLALAPASATSSTTSNRLQGSDRYGTAGAVAAAKFGSAQVNTAILADGLNFPDALAGSFLAGGGPDAILLTDPNTVPSNLSSALSSLKVKTVVILGQTQAVSQNVQNQLAATASTNSAGGNLVVSRIGGNTRYDTMQMIDTNSSAPAVGSISGKKTAIIASGANWPDALAAGGVAYSKNHLPIVLTDPSSLSPQASNTLSSLGIQQVLIMGGSAAISPTVNTQLTAKGITVLQQFAGVNRNDTAAQLATYEVANLGFSFANISLSRGDDFADALSGAQYNGDPVPLLILSADGPCHGLTDPTTNEISSNKSANNTITAFGGTAAICNTDLQAAVTAAGGSSGSTTTVTTPTQSIISGNGPQGSFPTLTSASINGANNFGGSTPTIVKYTFNKTINSSLITNPATGKALRLIGFNVTNTGGYSATATSFTSGDSATCTPDGDGQSVDCQYAASVNVSQYTIAVADSSAVTGTSPALVNPMGSVPFSGFSASTNGAGTLPNPVLTGVAVLSNNTVTYTFSQIVTGPPAPVPASFGYVTSDGTEVDATTASTPNSTSVNVGGFPAGSPTATNGVRFFVKAGAVTSSASGGSFTNPEGALSSTGGTAPSITDRPSLTSVSRVAGQPNQFDYVFDHAVSVGTIPDFLVYLSNATSPGGGIAATTAVQAGTNTIQAGGFAGITQANTNLVTLGTVTESGGPPPAAGAVTQNGLATTEYNTVGSAAVTGGSIQAGSANGPSLTTVAGTSSTNTVTFNFTTSISTTAPVAGGPNLHNFFVVTPTGALAFPGAGATISTSGSTVTINFGGTSIIGDIGAGVTSNLGATAPQATAPAFASPDGAQDFNGDFNAPADLTMTVS